MKYLTALNLNMPTQRLISLCVASFVTACGGGNGITQGTDNNPQISIDSGSLDLLAGNYSLTASPSINPMLPFVDCSVTPGQITIYNRQVIGYIDGYLTVMGSISDNGQMKATASSGTTLISEITGTFHDNGGGGRYSTSSLCQGTWTATRISYTAPDQGQQFILPASNYPAALRVKFTPTSGSTEGDVECTSASGLIDTDGRVASHDNEIDYRGYAETSAGYRWDVDLSIDTDTGEIDGKYRYEPLAIRGQFEGDAYFSGTPRVYESSSTSYDEGCLGRWEMTVVDIPFPESQEVLSDGMDQNSANQTDDSNNAVSIESNTTGEGISENAINIADQDSSWNTEISDNNAETDTDETVVDGSQIPNYANEIPSCEVARLRILSSVEPGMSPDEVMQLVGIPLDITGIYGTDWNYSTTSDAQIEFHYNSSQQPSIVQGYNTAGSSCSESAPIAQLRAAANDLAQQPAAADFSSEIPTCFDAATRTLARVRIGMTPEEVRRLVGKPNDIDGVYGTDWKYSDRVEIDFGYNSMRLPSVVNGYRTSKSVRCN